MGLCSLCEAIPWDSLPPEPFDILISLSSDAYVQEFWEWPQDYKGYSHYQSLEALKSSATGLGCGLCGLIYKQVELCRLKLEELPPGWETGAEFRQAWPLWNFWLTKRPGGDGFWVMSYTEKNGVVRLVAAIGLCAREDDPLASVLPGRPIEHDSGSSIAVSRALGWIDECNKHPSCCPQGTPLPSRVIDVGDDTGSRHVRVWETGGSEVGKYIALSYCWGKSPQLTTTKATLDDRKRGIAISDLPKTHQDSIALTRRFGVRYLWIDSMCICQDDYDDWERESARMQSVYANAYLTINASKAEDSSVGLFAELPAREYFEFEYTYGDVRGQALACAIPFHEAMQSTYILLDRDPISHRGWALQERVLSQRSLFYSSSQMMFECAQGFRAEDGWTTDQRFYSMCSQSEMGSDSGGEDEIRREGSTDEVLRSWYQLLSTYGGRKLTKPSDKLPAVSGLASIMAKQLNDEYIAGHWRTSLITELTWQPGNCRRVPEYRAPSWSWASVDGNIGIRLRQSGHILAEVLDIKIKLKGTSPYGEVTEGKLVIQGPVQRLYISTEAWDPERPPLDSENSPVVCTTSTNMETRYQYDFDAFAEDRAEQERRFVESLDGLELYALILLSYSFEEGHYVGLIIARSPGSGEYRRVGFLTMTDEVLGWKPGEQAKDELPIITLV